MLVYHIFTLLPRFAASFIHTLFQQKRSAAKALRSKRFFCLLILLQHVIISQHYFLTHSIFTVWLSLLVPLYTHIYPKVSGKNTIYYGMQFILPSDSDIISVMQNFREGLDETDRFNNVHTHVCSYDRSA
jgi:hypothetical protein